MATLPDYSGPARGVFYLLGSVDRERVPVGLRRRVTGMKVADVSVEFSERPEVFDLFVSRRIGQAECIAVRIREGDRPQQKDEDGAENRFLTRC